MAQASDGAIRVQASFFLGSAHDGHEAVIADEDDFEVADEAEEALEIQVSMQGVTALFLGRKFWVFRAHLQIHDEPRSVGSRGRIITICA